MDPARSASRSAKRQRGFTMIELMIVLVIFGMLVGMGIPSYQKYSRTQRLRGTSENLVQLIQLQRSRAMMTGQDVRINFNTAAPAGWTCIAEGRSNHTNLPNGVNYVSATPDFLILSRDGRANASGTIILSNTTGNSDTVSVQLSGFALIR
jgi:prepilin-type N-terminal cleavage/methylation domain-containing protein